jgi:hypothetical protein
MAVSYAPRIVFLDLSRRASYEHQDKDTKDHEWRPGPDPPAQEPEGQAPPQSRGGRSGQSLGEGCRRQEDQGATKGNGTTRHYNLTDIITVLVDSNPKMEGSAARKRFSLYKTGMTVEAALAAGLWAADIRHDSKKEHIKLSKS